MSADQGSRVCAKNKVDLYFRPKKNKVARKPPSSPRLGLATLFYFRTGPRPGLATLFYFRRAACLGLIPRQIIKANTLDFLPAGAKPSLPAGLALATLFLFRGWGPKIRLTFILARIPAARPCDLILFCRPKIK